MDDKKKKKKEQEDVDQEIEKFIDERRSMNSGLKKLLDHLSDEKKKKKDC